jgi:hypothetical protein
MSREVVFLRWCSLCESDGVERVEAVEAYTIGLVKGETRPAPRVLDVCDTHAEELLALSVVVAKHSIPLDPKAKPSPMPEPKAVATATGRPLLECKICGKSTTKNNMTNHIWSHSPTPRPPQPARCPTCGERVDRAMGVHRSQAHGWSPIEDAYEQVIPA